MEWTCRTRTAGAGASLASVGMDTTEWYWCLTHTRPEPADERDDPDNALGPYPSEAAARNWKQQHEARDAAWRAQDEAWDGEPPQDG